MNPPGHDARRVRASGALRRDARDACRALVGAPGVNALIILVLALGIGAATTFFSLAYGVLLRPLPWPEPDRVVRLEERRGGRPGRIPWTISNSTYHAWHEAPDTIESIGGWMRTQSMTLTDRGEPERVRVGRVTPSLFTVLQVHPVAGRPLSPSDIGSDGPRAVLLGYRMWQRRFGGAADAVGRTLRFDDRSVIVAGVMPRDFAFPDREAEAWLPLPVARVEAGADVIRAMIFNAVARLRPGVTPEQAASEGASRARAAPRLGMAAVGLFGSDGEIAVSALPVRTALTADVRPALVILLAAVALLFCSALASVVVLQSSRAVRRRREAAVRAALGASPRDLARHSLAHSVLLGLAGACAGTLVAAALHQILPALLPADFPRADHVRLDGVVVLFALASATAATIASGLAPALQPRHSNLVEALASDSTMSGASAAGRRAGRVRAAMMVVQIAVACVLLVGTGLLARSFAALLSADRGFDPHNVLTAHLSVPPRPFASGATALERAQARLRALPGVTHVAFGNALPYVTSGGFRGLTLPSPGDPGMKIQAQTLMRTIHPEYFDALRLRVVAGRALDSGDTPSSRPVVVVNRTFAARYLGPHPVGQVLPFVASSRREWEVVGVVDDVRQGGFSGVAPVAFGGLTEPPQPELFFTYRQWDTSVAELVFVIRNTADSSTLAPSLRAILRDEDSSLAIDSILTMDERVLNSLARPRTYAVLVGGFASFALLVAGIGLFGTMSYVTAQRTREFGVRTALGARPRDIAGLVTREAAAVAITGLAAGLAAAVLLTRSLRSLIYGVSPHDPVSFVAVPLLLVAVMALACAVPARRAARVSPLVALKGEDG